MTDRVDLEPDSRSAGRRTLLGFLAAFLALVAVQASFAYLAVSTDPGLASPNAYERGLAHNTVLREAASEASGSLADSLGQVERSVLLEALRDGASTRREIAERLGISPRTLRYKLARLRAAGVDVPAV